MVQTKDTHEREQQLLCDRMGESGPASLALSSVVQGYFPQNVLLLYYTQHKHHSKVCVSVSGRPPQLRAKRVTFVQFKKSRSLPCLELAKI